jgi:acyl-CoA synthetase (AMP-forming)/AMP-acid ligase II
MSQDTGAGNTIHRVFEDCVRRVPSAIAIRCGTEQVSYSELNKRANQLAWFLRARGLPDGGLVAVSMERSPDLIVAMLAVLKAGGAYVPVEPSAPEPLIRRAMDAAHPFAVLTHESQRVRLADAVDGLLVCLDTDAALIAEQQNGILPSDIGPRDLACVFFTSGSSGPPKGSLIEHRNLLSALHGWLDVFGFTRADRHLQTTTFEFDVFTADWLRALGSGGTLVLAKRNFTLDRTASVEELHTLILAEQITVMETSTLLARRLSTYLQTTGAGLGHVRLLMVGAAKWYLDEHVRLQEHLGDKVRVANTYGVAEASIDNTYFETSMLRGPLTDHPGRVSLIGRPFPGTEIAVVDPADGGVVLPGQAGEIRISGSAVGRGYLADGEPAAARLGAQRSGTDVLHHHTGDIGILRQDGLLEYVGRIEDGRTLAEASWRNRLEGLVREHPEVSECVVGDIAADGRSPGLAAYVVPVDPERGLDTGSVLAATDLALGSERHAGGEDSSTAPGLDAVVPLAALPRTRAGKIDHRRLPLPAPRGPLTATAGGNGSGKGRGGASLKASGPGGATAGTGTGCMWLVTTVFFAIIAVGWTHTLWRSSTDLTAVPGKWHPAFVVLYLFEDVSFGLGVAFLFLGRPMLRRLDRPRGLTTAAHLSIVWLLAAWWPQDNSYRTTDPTDWPAQTALVYGFNITLMIAAALVVAFLATSRRTSGR